MRNGREMFDVVIVGAGISGLSVARGLTRRGLSAVVLEARDRVGGRLRTDRGLDLGATWFWPNEPRVQELIAELGLETHGQHLAGDAMFHTSTGPARLDGNPIDAPSGRFLLGAEELAQAASRLLPEDVVRLSHRVREIHYLSEGESRIEAHTERGGFAGRHLVLAIPPALAVHQLAFSPPLPEGLTTLASRTPVWMGSIAKVVARYSLPFWRRAGLAGVAISHIGPMREIHDMSGPAGDPAALFGFVPSTEAGASIGEAEILAQLVEIFGPEAGEPEHLLIQDWRLEPYTSPPGVEFLSAFEVFGDPAYASPSFGGCLHWSSTETAPEFPGHIEGALAAAERAVAAICEALEQSPGRSSEDDTRAGGSRQGRRDPSNGLAPTQLHPMAAEPES